MIHKNGNCYETLKSCQGYWKNDIPENIEETKTYREYKYC